MKIRFEIQNCYGIGAMNEELSLRDDSKVAVVYAPNGTMKSSLTRTISQLLAGKDPCDEFYTERESRAKIIFNGEDINKENTYVFVNENADGTKQISTFLANADLKAQYDAIFQQLDGAKKALKRHVKAVAQSSDCEDEIMQAFKVNDEDTYFDCLLLVEQQLESGEEVLEGYDFKFNDVFDKEGKIREFICDNIGTIQRYFEKYTSLIKNSTFFNSGAKFGTSQANSLLKSVEDDRYFQAGHKFELGGDKQPVSIACKKDMKDVIDREMERIFTNDDIKTLFNDLESKLDKNAKLKAFKDVIQAHPELIPELVDYDCFQKKILRGYLKQCAEEMKALTDLYVSKKDELKDIVRKANSEQSQWEKVIGVFNSRFYVPFTLELQNKSDILLNAKAPELQFMYRDGGDAPIQQERKTLIEHLSTGEKRAFSILQNIFELEARRNNGKETLLVFDDIADSFDYKNKYAIIEYLYDLKQYKKFTLFILTHNFDFYRTVISRLDVKGNVFFANKKEDRTVELKLGTAKPDILKRKILDIITQKRPFIACIPFVRNILEYTEGTSEKNYSDLTECLHLKERTGEITMSEIMTIFQNVIKTVRDKSISFGDEYYLKALNEEAEAILTDPNEVEIVNKLVLSMAIRINAETYMKGLLTEKQLSEIEEKHNQTAVMLRAFKESYKDDKKNEIMVMNKVLMLTSENIHINNFMFEPLVDISILHLKQLYNEVKALLNSTC